MATDVAPAVVADLEPIVLACEAVGSPFALFEAFDAVLLLCVEYAVACVADVAAVGDAAATFCKLAPCALKADKKLPKNGL